MGLKMRIANLIDRIPGQCWSDLAGWALTRYRDDPDPRSAVPWKPQGWMCRQDAARNGRCYCGKLAADGSTLKHGQTVEAVIRDGR